MLRLVYPERDSSVAEFTLSEAEVLSQNDKRQRARKDKKRGAHGQGDKRDIWIVTGWQLGQK